MGTKGSISYSRKLFSCLNYVQVHLDEGITKDYIHSLSHALCPEILCPRTQSLTYTVRLIELALVMTVIATHRIWVTLSHTD